MGPKLKYFGKSSQNTMAASSKLTKILSNLLKPGYIRISKSYRRRKSKTLGKVGQKHYCLLIVQTK